MSGVDAHRFVLEGSKLLLDEGFNGDKDSLIRITVQSYLILNIGLTLRYSSSLKSDFTRTTEGHDDDPNKVKTSQIKFQTSIITSISLLGPVLHETFFSPFPIIIEKYCSYFLKFNQF